MKFFDCYSSKIADYLRNKGFKVVRTEVDKEKPWFQVFFLEDTEELRKAIQEYRIEN